MSDENTLQLFPYQKEGAEYLASHRRALLADEMGLGKSAQAIHAADILSAKKVLVFCPAIARINWKREFEKFSHIKRTFTIVTNAKTEIPEDDSVICSYDLAEKIAPKLKNRTSRNSWPVVILDESHYLKSVEAQRTKAIFGRQGVARSSNRVWCLTGTPMPNNPSDLWVMMRTFGITQLTYDDFIERFCEYYVFNNKKCISGAKSVRIPELKFLLSQFTLRRNKTMVKLPPIYFKDLVIEANEVDLEVDPVWVTYVSPQDRRAEFYKKLAEEKDLIEKALVKVGPRDSEAAGMVSGIATCIPTLRRYVGLQKVEHIAKMIERDLHDGAYEKVVIFAVHQAVIEGLRDRLHKYGAVTLYGQTPIDKRQRHIDNFQKNPKTRVFIANIQAAGTAINLTAAHNVFFVELDYSPANMAQAACRVHRHGQNNPVMVTFVSLVNSMDETVSQILRRKTKDIIELLDQQLLTTKESANITTRNQLVANRRETESAGIKLPAIENLEGENKS